MNRFNKQGIQKLFTLIRSYTKPKIFCISFQRTGTTSTGQFFKDHGYSVAGYPWSRKNNWTLKWFSGDYEAIFNSWYFKLFTVFEDDPWWCHDFYKVLFHRFPNSKFILFERDSDDWFNSMVSHSNGRTLGNTYGHAKLYGREKEFYGLKKIDNYYTSYIDNLLPLNEEHREHYKEVYELRNQSVKDFFKEFDPERLFTCSLEDPQKWIKMGNYFRINVHLDYEAHKNKSN